MVSSKRVCGTHSFRSSKPVCGIPNWICKLLHFHANPFVVPPKWAHNMSSSKPFCGTGKRTTIFLRTQFVVVRAPTKCLAKPKRSTKRLPHILLLHTTFVVAKSNRMLKALTRTHKLFPEMFVVTGRQHDFSGGNHHRHNLPYQNY